ncbi:hypothetical protein [Pseudomonas sp.]|uniref:hypothetical protein n=1 Tax=Pseudomonas sp. TaxID=306 RepID=UPI003FD6C6A3
MPRPKKSEQPSVNVSLRIDPKIKFAIELLAREQKRSITGVIEWAVMQALQGQIVRTPSGNEITMLELMDLTWSPDEAERVTMLGIFSPHTLNHEETCIWTVIRSSGIFLRGENPDARGMATTYVPKMNFIKTVWPLLKARGKTLADWPNIYQTTILTEGDLIAEFGEDIMKEADEYFK